MIAIVVVSKGFDDDDIRLLGKEGRILLTKIVVVMIETIVGVFESGGAVTIIEKVEVVVGQLLTKIVSEIDKIGAEGINHGVAKDGNSQGLTFSTDFFNRFWTRGLGGWGALGGLGTENLLLDSGWLVTEWLRVVG